MPRRENAHRGDRRGKRSRQRILIVCGAARTESDYIQGMRDALMARTVDINVRVRPKSPLYVVERAVELMAGSDFDEAWCVFDVDEFSVEPAVALAANRKIHLAISDPCFEVWLLLHHEDCRAFQSGYKDVVRRLKKYVAGYDKTKLDFTDYSDGVADATRRAEKLGDTGNPSTGMWRLAMRIRNEEEK